MSATDDCCKEQSASRVQFDTESFQAWGGHHPSAYDLGDIVDHRYLQYCRRDSVFYRKPVLRSDAGTLRTFGRPESWTWGRSGDWEFWAPQDPVHRTHGWKIHVSATPRDAEKTLATVADICVRTATAFKFVPTMAEFLSRNAKSADRAGSGKFITVYPDDDRALATIATLIDEDLGGKPSPYILSDVRYRSGPVYFRYGGFRQLTLPNANDEEVSVIPTPSGHLSPDQRLPHFVAPTDAPCPPIVAQAIETYNRSDARTPLDDYQSIEPLHFSNGGGVYSAIRDDGRRTILKEARPEAGLDFRGRDAVTRLHAEAQALAALAPTGLTPSPIRQFTAWEHEYLEMEFIQGVNLADWTVRNFPFRRDDPSHARIYSDLAVEIISNMTKTIASIHAAGLVIGDLHPGNIMIMPDLSVRIIDLEDSRPAQSVVAPGFNVIGYRAPDGFDAENADWYAASRAAASVFVIDFVLEVLSPSHWRTVLTKIATEFEAHAAAAVQKIETRISAPRTTSLLYRPDEIVESWPASGDVSDEYVHETIGHLIEGIEQAHGAITGPAFPGDIAQHEGLGNINISTGSSGVLLALHRAGHDVNQAMVDTLETQALSSSTSKSGLFDGIVGVAVALHELGRESAARHLLAAVSRRSTSMRRVDLYGGLAGVGTALATMGNQLNESSYVARAKEIAKTLEHRLLLSGNSQSVEAISARGGLLYGWSGVSLLFSELACITGEAAYGDMAGRLIAQDLNLTTMGTSGSLGVLDAGRHRSLPYLSWGSAGILIALARLRALPGHAEDFTEYDKGLIQACSNSTYAFSGLFNGRAGIVTALATTVSPSPNHELKIREQIAGLRHTALKWRNTMQFAGENYMRLSTDLSTGSAGVLSALVATRNDPNAWLPLPSGSGSAKAPSPIG